MTHSLEQCTKYRKSRKYASSGTKTPEGIATKRTVGSAVGDPIDVKNVFYVFYFKIKNAFLTFFIFPTFLLIKNVGQQFQL